MEEMLYSFLDPVHFFFYATHQFTLVATGGTSHFHTAAIKFSCYSSKVIGLLCLLSLALALSVINIDILRSFIRELKMETFSGRRRPDWQRKPGTKAAVAPRQK